MPYPLQSSRVRTHRTHARAAALALALVAASASACGGQAGAPATSPAPAPRPAQSVGPMDISGQRVLILPVQSVSGTGGTRADATREVVFALGERNDRVHWVSPDQLRSALQRSPGYADDPDVLPSDAFKHHRERYIVEPLGGLLRRYSALMDTRMVLIPQSAQWIPNADGSAGGVIRMAAVVIDTRTANVVWYGEADGQPRPAPDAGALATAAASLAAHLLVPGGS
jgi:hypothetical protein